MRKGRVESGAVRIRFFSSTVFSVPLCGLGNYSYAAQSSTSKSAAARNSSATLCRA